MIIFAYICQISALILIFQKKTKIDPPPLMYIVRILIFLSKKKLQTGLKWGFKYLNIRSKILQTFVSPPSSSMNLNHVPVKHGNLSGKKWLVQCTLLYTLTLAKSLFTRYQKDTATMVTLYEFKSCNCRDRRHLFSICILSRNARIISIRRYIKHTTTI